MCHGGGIVKALEPVIGAAVGSALLPGIGTELGLGASGLATAGGALGGLAGGALSGASGLPLILDAVGGGFAPNASDVFNSIGNGLSSFADSTGLSQLFGGTPLPTDSLNAVGNAAPSADVTAGATSQLATAPGGVSSSYLPSTGASSLGGGGIGGGFNPSVAGETTSLPSALGNAGTYSFDLSGNPSSFSEGLGAGIGAQPSSQGFLSSIFSPSSNAGGFNYDLSGAPAGASSYSIPSQFANAATSSGGGTNMLSNPFGGGGGNSNQLVNGLLKAGIGGLLNNPNNKGYNAQMNAANQVIGDYQPYLQSGTAAANTLADLYGLNGSTAQQSAQQNWAQTPGYQFALQQGMNAVNADAAAKGQLLSGNNQQAIQQYGTGLANRTYNNYLSNLQNQAGMGLNAAGGVGSGQVGLANAMSGKSGAGAANQNATTAGILSALFPQNSINLGGIPMSSSNSNSGILQLLFGS